MDFMFLSFAVGLLETTVTDGSLMQSISDALTVVVQWFGTIISALLASGGALSALWPLLAIGIAISLVFVGVKVIRSFTWGA